MAVRHLYSAALAAHAPHIPQPPVVVLFLIVSGAAALSQPDCEREAGHRPSRAPVREAQAALGFPDICLHFVLSYGDLVDLGGGKSVCFWGRLS